MAWRHLAALIFIVLGSATARAGFDESRSWFDALPFDQRIGIQRQLLLLGHYDLLVDGRFGQGTFSGLTGFQRELAHELTGVLSSDDLVRLRENAELASGRVELANAAVVSETGANLATSLRTFGDFSLPETRPSVIELNGAIDDSSARDFARALEARPAATVLVLNSPGGYVDTALLVANQVFERRMNTVVPVGATCFSACAYIYFAGAQREVLGELGVHQIETRIYDLVFAQNTLSDILDALYAYGVKQTIVSRMLRTPPEDMYVFTMTEISEWEINRGGPIQLADASADVSAYIQPEAAETQVAAYVHLAQFASRAEAERSLEGAKTRWTGILGDAMPVVEAVTRGSRESFRISVPARSLETANTMCAAIKSSGGGCYVTQL